MHLAAGLVSALAADDSSQSTEQILPKVPELIIGGLGFLVLLFILWKFAFPMFEKTFAERTEAIEGGIQRAERAQAEAAVALEQYQAALADARGEAAAIRAEAHSERQRIIEDARADAQTTADGVTTRAQASIEADRTAAQSELSREVGRIAMDLASKIVGESLSDDARARATVDRFIADLEASAPAAGAH